MNLVRNNLMTIPNYTPYCGGEHCRMIPRTGWDGGQFKCSCCGWRSQFPTDFIEQYKAKWSK